MKSAGSYEGKDLPHHVESGPSDLFVTLSLLDVRYLLSNHRGTE